MLATMSDDEWLTIDQASKYSKLSRSTLYQWTKDGRLEFKDQPRGGRLVSRAGLDQILAPVVEASPVQAVDRLVAGFDRLLRESYQLLADNPPKLDSVGKWVPYAIFGLLLRNGRALHQLLSSGYVEEGRAIGRVMMAAALNIVAIVDADSDGRALQFLAYQRPLRRKALDRLVAQGHLTQQRRDAIDTADTDAEDKTLAGYAAAGITPQPIGKGQNTWHGLNDRDLAIRMKAERWYDIYYGPLSDMGAHGNIASLTGIVNEMLAGSFVVGPSRTDPTHVVMAASDAVGEATCQLERHFALGKSAEAEAIHQRAQRSILMHAH
jgi:excisionase family DNA binding protein